MARPRKEGLEYYPFDTDFYEDDKIQLVLSDFGIKGTHIFSRLLCAIYKGNGYYYAFGDDECRLLSRKTCGEVSETEVRDIVQGLLKRGLFDKGMYESHGILTGRGIQKRYLLITSKTKRLAPIDEMYRLIDIKSDVGLVYSEEIGSKLGGNEEETNEKIEVSSEISTQKEREREKENITPSNNARAGKQDFDQYTEFYIDSLKSDYMKKCGIVESCPDYVSMENFDVLLEKFRSWMRLTERKPRSYGQMISTLMNWLRIEHEEKLKLEKAKNNQNYGKSGTRKVEGIPSKGADIQFGGATEEGYKTSI